MAQLPDRWAARILALPVFDDSFAKAIQQSPYSNLALIAAMEVRSPSEFVVKVHDWSGQLPEDVRIPLLADQFMLEQFWSLASSVEKAFFESTSQQLGFGMCDPVTVAISASTAKARREKALKALLARPTPPPRKILKPAPKETATPLLDQENAARQRWAGKLEEIGRKAGQHSKLLNDTVNSEGLTADETARLRKLVLASGAPRTMQAHISAWERFDDWAASEGIDLFPLTSDKILKYALELDQRECGPSVLPSFRTSIKWITSKLAVDCPDLAHPALLAVQEDIIKKRASTVKEAVPIPIEAVGCLEMFVADSSAPEPARLFMWWWLCMIFASLRFDDAMHVKPSELVWDDQGLFGVAWQTKVERRRRGTKFVVPRVGFKESNWLEIGFELLREGDLDRDYWMQELNTVDQFRAAPATYQRSVQWLRSLSKKALKDYFTGPDRVYDRVWEQLDGLTAHSARVTLLDAAVHAGRTTEEIGLQANWKNPGPLVLKYTRNRTSIPAQMIQQLVKDLADHAHPIEVPDGAVLDEADQTALDEIEFYVKSSGGRAVQDYRYHCAAQGEMEAIACGRLPFDQCTAVGSTIPDVAMLCKHCARARPDVASRCFSVTAKT